MSLNGQTGRIRLIGVDTPDPSHPSRPVECFGREAAVFTREVLWGQMVLLEDDPTQDNRDRYNRLLRFVWLPDGRLGNDEIIAQGYGFEYTFRTPHRSQAQFKAADRAARQAQIGLWAPETCNGERTAADAVTPVARMTPTAAPEATPLPPSFDGRRTEPNAALAPNAPVAIVAIDKRAEVVTLRNVSTATVNLDGWTMCSKRGAQIHPSSGRFYAQVRLLIIDGRIAALTVRQFLQDSHKPARCKSPKTRRYCSCSFRAAGITMRSNSSTETCMM